MKSREGIIQKYETFAEHHPIIASVGETAVIYGLKYAAEKAGDRVGVNVGHGRKNRPGRAKFIEDHPFIAAGAATVWAPISEELLFRELPDRVLKKRGHESDSQAMKKSRLVSIGAFTLAHAGPDAIPINQLIGGLNYDRIHHKRGLKASIIAHITNNSLVAARYIANKKRH